MRHLKKGDKAPNFTAKNQDGKAIELASYRGKKIVLFFYPKASTPGCTMEAKNLRDHYNEFKEKGYEILGISADSEKRQKNFCIKNELPYSLLVDEEKEIIKAYGVWGPKKFMGREYEGIHRTTFIIDEKGVINNIIEKVKTKVHAEQIFQLQS